MSTDIIDRAGQVTRSIKSDIAYLIQKLHCIDTTCNALGVLNDHGMVMADLDTVIRKVQAIQYGIIHTQWPKAADYAEV